MEMFFYELGEKADLQAINIDNTYFKVHKASTAASRERGTKPVKGENMPSQNETACEDRSQANQCIFHA